MAVTHSVKISAGYLCGIGARQIEGPEPSRLESSDPMREAGAPSTEEVVPQQGVPAPPGVVMVAPQTLLRNASMAQI